MDWGPRLTARGNGCPVLSTLYLLAVPNLSTALTSIF